ncbi:MAG: L,D-peptidoglycan transpeptidase YkuD (ErfK/YbiS/YcfS/YnhG family) [Paraglaciecola sp.]|jgi:L,D-peptidoglycan transpeptidase YkuD (ErfK/YbiS/YcfS/YnhG family)
MSKDKHDSLPSKNIDNTSSKERFTPIASINDHLQTWIGLSTKILIICGALVALLFIFGKLVKSDGLVFTELEVPEKFIQEGYSGKLLSRQFAQRILTSKKDVPKKLTFLFASDRVGEERARLEENIAKNYNSEQKEVELSVGLGVFDLPIDSILDSLRKLIGTNPTKVVGILADRNGSLFYNVGLLDSKKGTHYRTFHREYKPDEKFKNGEQDDKSLHAAIITLIDQAAGFVLEKYDPLVEVLEDYSAEVVYSSSKNSWCNKKGDKEEDKEKKIKEEKLCYKRLLTLLNNVVKENDNSQSVQIAHALLGDIYERKNKFGKAIEQYELAIEVDDTFVTTVGIKLANRYLHEATASTGYIPKARKLLLKMLSLDPDGRLPYVRLLALYSTQLEVLMGTSSDDKHETKLGYEYETIVQQYQKLMPLAVNENERISTYKGLSEVLAWLGSKEELLESLDDAFMAGMRLYDHDMKFLPFKKFVDDQDFIAMRKKKYPTKDSSEIKKAKEAKKSEIDELFKNFVASDSFPTESEQVVVVVSSDRSDVDAKMHTFEKNIKGKWELVLSDMRSSLGREGISLLEEKREGDGKVPAGIFNLESAFGYLPKINTNLKYKQVTDNDYWIDDSRSPKYNTWVTTQLGELPTHPGKSGEPPKVSSHETLKRSDHLYKYAIVVGYNNGVDKLHKSTDGSKKRVGKGSAIFLHWERAPGAPTAGCVATSRENMLDLLKWLEPEKTPIIAMGTLDDFKTKFKKKS